VWLAAFLFGGWIMRSAFALILLMSASVAVLSSASAQRAPTTGSASASATPPAAVPAPSPAPGLAIPATPPKCTNPNALGVSRTVEVDTAGGPGFGGEHFKQHDFLRNKEVVLTFDDGPWPTTTAVLKALADECVRVTFFPIGKHATYYPEILKAMYDAGHTIGSHTWSHKNIESIKDPAEQKAEIEKGISAVSMSAGVPMAPFFRFPALRHPAAMVTYVGERNLGIFSTDMDSFDFKMRKPEQVVNAVMTKLEKHGKGIVLLHDFQTATSQAVPDLLAQLKAKGYKIVHMRAKDPVKPLAEYDEMVKKEQKLPTVSTRPTSSVIRTVE
jgi:peptidoglycan/xylan/chitin deacetylase (PgdA/CDA1 family)